MNTLHNLSRRLLASLALILPLAAPANAQNLSYDATNYILTISGNFTHDDLYDYAASKTVIFTEDCNITSFPDNSFKDFENMTSITLPETLTSLSYRAFAWSGLTSINIPNKVTTIGEQAFQ